MKNLKIYIMGFMFVYLIFAFGQWDLNPERWVTETRYSCAFLLFIVGLSTFIISKLGNTK